MTNNTRGRKPTPPAENLSAVLNNEAVAQASQAMDMLSVRSAEIAQSYGDGLPYDRLRVVHQARFYMAQSAEAMLEAGKCLVQLKENEPHGEFMQIVSEQLGLAPRTAQLMMQAAVKYLSPALAANAKSISHLGKTKLFNLMAESDEDLAELAEGGTLAGLHLAEIDTMSVAELKAALVEKNKALQAKDHVITKKDQKLNEWSEAEQRRLSASRDEAETAQLTDLREATLSVELAMEQFISTVDGVMSSGRSEAASLAARQALDYITRRLEDAAEARGIVLNLADRVVPLHMKPVHEAAAGGNAGKLKN